MSDFGFDDDVCGLSSEFDYADVDGDDDDDFDVSDEVDALTLERSKPASALASGCSHDEYGFPVVPAPSLGERPNGRPRRKFFVPDPSRQEVYDFADGHPSPLPRRLLAIDDHVTEPLGVYLRSLRAGALFVAKPALWAETRPPQVRTGGVAQLPHQVLPPQVEAKAHLLNRRSGRARRSVYWRQACWEHGLQHRWCG